jgi:hypothetical protein
VVVDCLELGSFTVTVYEKLMLGVGFREARELFPFRVGAVEVIGSSYANDGHIEVVLLITCSR